jgi:hypothetical protein
MPSLLVHALAATPYCQSMDLLLEYILIAKAYTYY